MSFGLFIWYLFLAIVFFSVAGGLSYTIYESKDEVVKKIKDSIIVVPIVTGSAWGAVMLLDYIKNKYYQIKKNNKSNLYNIE